MSGHPFHVCTSCQHIASEQQCMENSNIEEENDYIQFRCPNVQCGINTCKCNHCSVSILDNDVRSRKRKKSHRGLMQEHVRRHTNKNAKQRHNINQVTDNVLQNYDASEEEENQLNDDATEWDPTEEWDEFIGSNELQEENRLDDDANEWARRLDNNLPLPPCNECVDQSANSYLYCNIEKDKEVIYCLNEKTFARIYPPYINEKNRSITNPAYKYMWQKYQEKMNSSNMNNAGGFQGLVSRSLACDQSDTGKIATEEEARLMFRYFNLVVDMPEEMQNNFLLFLNSYDKAKNCNSGIRVPNERSDFNQKIKGGAQSMYNNFPSPLVEERFDHATINLKELLLLMAGHGVQYNFGLEGETKTRRRDGLNGTKAMDDLIANVKGHMSENGVDQSVINKTSIGYIILWSDAFLRCFIKQKDNSVWILTATVCPPESKKLSDMYTYVLAIGRSDQDHTPVINHFIKQLNELKTGFYWYNGNSNKMERVAFDMIAYSADRPERQSLLGNRKEGTFGRAQGFAANPSTETFPSCLDCYVQHLKSIFKQEFISEGTTCSKCNDFTFNEDNSCDHNTTTAKHYPKSHPQTAEPMPEGRSSGILTPKLIKLTTEFTQMAVRSAYYGVKDGEWSSDNCDAYLALCNINGSVARLVYTMAIEDKESVSDRPERVQHEVWKLLPSCFVSHTFPIVPMHCLMHGMGPDSFDLVNSIFSDYNKLTDFISYANNVLSDIATLSLDYCRVKILPKSAWVAENSLAFIRLMSYLYGTYLTNNFLDGATGTHAKLTALHIKCFVNAFQVLVAILMGERSSNKAVIQTHIKLTMACSHYLQLHHNKRGTVSDEDSFLGSLGIGVLKAMASELQLKISDKAKRSAIIKKIKNCTVDVIKSKLQSFQDHAVGEKFRKIEWLEKLYYVMEEKGIFTDKMREEEEEYHRTKFVWEKGNWLTLLGGISDQVEYLGSIRWIYESRNEAQIGPTKKVLRAYRRNPVYLVNRMTHLQKLLGLQVVEMTAFKDREDDSALRYSGIHFYYDRDEIVTRYTEGRPICGTRSKECKTIFNVYIRSGARGTVSQVNLRMEPENLFNPEVETGLHFCKFTPPSDQKDVATIFSSQDECALLLPLTRDNDDSFQGYFTVIYNDYDVLRADLTDKKEYPKVCRSTFTNDYLDSLREL